MGQPQSVASPRFGSMAVGGLLASSKLPANNQATAAQAANITLEETKIAGKFPNALVHAIFIFCLK